MKTQVGSGEGTRRRTAGFAAAGLRHWWRARWRGYGRSGSGKERTRAPPPGRLPRPRTAWQNARLWRGSALAQGRRARCARRFGSEDCRRWDSVVGEPSRRSRRLSRGRGRGGEGRGGTAGTGAAAVGEVTWGRRGGSAGGVRDDSAGDGDGAESRVFFWMSDASRKWLFPKVWFTWAPK
jgi:hypothetical protein